jgi:hypothetical protein
VVAQALRTHLAFASKTSSLTGTAITKLKVAADSMKRDLEPINGDDHSGHRSAQSFRLGVVQELERPEGDLVAFDLGRTLPHLSMGQIEKGHR